MAVEKKITACMVLYHSGDETMKAVQCLEDSQNVQVELFLVDNSPEDDLATKIRWQYPGVTVLSQKKNIGFGRGNNQVLGRLRYKYHLMLNPDVTFTPDLLERMIDYMDHHPDCAVLTPRVFNQDGTEQFLPKEQPTVRYLLSGFLSGVLGLKKWAAATRREYTHADNANHLPMCVGFATGCFLLIRTEVFEKLRGFDERFFLYQEDSDLSIRVREYGNIIYHPGMCITHTWGRENTRSFKGVSRQMRSIVKLFWKWGIRW